MVKPTKRKRKGTSRSSGSNSSSHGNQSGTGGSGVGSSGRVTTAGSKVNILRGDGTPAGCGVVVGINRFDGGLIDVFVDGPGFKSDPINEKGQCLFFGPDRSKGEDPFISLHSDYLTLVARPNKVTVTKAKEARELQKEINSNTYEPQEGDLLDREMHPEKYAVTNEADHPSGHHRRKLFGVTSARTKKTKTSNNNKSKTITKTGPRLTRRKRIGRTCKGLHLLESVEDERHREIELQRKLEAEKTTESLNEKEDRSENTATTSNTLHDKKSGKGKDQLAAREKKIAKRKSGPPVLPKLDFSLGNMWTELITPSYLPTVPNPPTLAMVTNGPESSGGGGNRSRR
eukprot:g2243.t1